MCKNPSIFGWYYIFGAQYLWNRMNMYIEAISKCELMSIRFGRGISEVYETFGTKYHCSRVHITNVREINTKIGWNTYIRAVTISQPGFTKFKEFLGLAHTTAKIHFFQADINNLVHNNSKFELKFIWELYSSLNQSRLNLPEAYLSCMRYLVPNIFVNRNTTTIWKNKRVLGKSRICSI